MNWGWREYRNYNKPSERQTEQKYRDHNNHNTKQEYENHNKTDTR